MLLAFTQAMSFSGLHAVHKYPSDSFLNSVLCSNKRCACRYFAVIQMAQNDLWLPECFYKCCYCFLNSQKSVCVDSLPPADQLYCAEIQKNKHNIMLEHLTIMVIWTIYFNQSSFSLVKYNKWRDLFCTVWHYISVIAAFSITYNKCSFCNHSLIIKFSRFLHLAGLDIGLQHY